MAFEELNTRIPEIPTEEQPDIMAYSMLRNFVADLAPRATTDGMEMWAEFRYRFTGEANYPRWTKDFYLNGQNHTVALYRVNGEAPGGEKYSHSALRCSCSLPDYKSFVDLEAEYEPCPAKESVLDERVLPYKQILGSENIGRVKDDSLAKATEFVLDVVRRDQFAWPPSHRSDRLLVERLAQVFDISETRMMRAIEVLQEDELVRIHGQNHPSVSLAA